jgi:FeS assembly protein IscX
MDESFSWLDVEEIGEALAAAHPTRDPMRVRFTELRGLVEALPGFVADPEHPVNEKILETIQAEWYRVKQGLPPADE